MKHNRVEFIKYMMEYVDISKYLSDNELLELYNSQVLDMLDMDHDLTVTDIVLIMSDMGFGACMV